MKINPTSLTVSQLLGAQNEQYVIPAYQRRYSWGQQQVKDLWADINILEGADTHLLGTIVCLTGHHQAGINQLELVDGQQRLTTLSILLCCLLERLQEDGRDEEAQDLKKLLRSKPLGGEPISKIALDSLDSKQYEEHVNGRTPETIENSRLNQAFEYTRGQIAACTTEDVIKMAYRLQNQAVLIRLDVSDARNAFKLFETINNRGLSLSPTDIIKNFILGNAARFGSANLALAKDQWARLIKYLDGIGSEAFFRHFMMALLKRRVTSSFVVAEFQATFMLRVEEAEKLPDRTWYCDPHTKSFAPVEPEDEELIEEAEEVKAEDDDDGGSEDIVERVSFEQFIRQIVDGAKIYRELVFGTTGTPKLDRRLRNLRLIKSQPSYGFLMHLRAGGANDSDFEEVLKMTETFMLRRHICRERTGENEAVFSRLCAVDPADPVTEVGSVYHDYCPDDAKFKTEFAAAQFNSSLIDRARYCLEQVEMNYQGEFSEIFPGGSDSVQVEHIIPQKITTRKAINQFGDWPAYLGDDAVSKHTKFVTRIGNLSLFAGELNIRASNNPYDSKKLEYRKSALKLTNSLPDSYPEFRFSEVESRSANLADIAVRIWPAL